MIVDRYYYHQLNKQEQAIYKAFYKGVMSHQEIIPIPVRGEFSQESSERIFMAMTRDNPLIYFLNQSACSTASDMFGRLAICPQYFFTKEKVKEYNRKIEKVVNELAGQLGQTLAEMALSWILKDDHVTSVLIGASKPEQILDNIGIIGHTSFSKEELDKIDAIVK